jgi:Flp pilus assembly pilin Flp
MRNGEEGAVMSDVNQGKRNSAGNTIDAPRRQVGVKIKSVKATRRGGNRMNDFSKMMVRALESKKGQTMTEYVLIIAAIAVAGYIAYQGLEGGINTIITNVTTTLKGA